MSVVALHGKEMFDSFHGQEDKMLHSEQIILTYSQTVYRNIHLTQNYELSVEVSIMRAVGWWS
jgi:hypothetical protein